MQDVGIKILDTNKSANATLTINALPGNNRGFFSIQKHSNYMLNHFGTESMQINDIK